MLMHVLANKLQNPQQTEVGRCNSKHQCLLTLTENKLPIASKDFPMLGQFTVSLSSFQAPWRHQRASDQYLTL